MLTSFHIDPKRGIEGMNRIGLLGRFEGSLIHDFLSSYYKFSCMHFLCAAHLLRELIYLLEVMDQKWAQEMIDLLLEAKQLREREDSRPENSRHVIGDKTRQRIRNRYSQIVETGLKLNPEPERPKPKKGEKKKTGPIKRSKALNLLRRLDKRYEEIMGFFEQEGIPFDNNLSERDLRMMKVREKISGTFRGEAHPSAFADIRSVISTTLKQSRNVLHDLKLLFRAPEDLGRDLAAQKGAE